jgi:hypothetical protein
VEERRFEYLIGMSLALALVLPALPYLRHFAM